MWRNGGILALKFKAECTIWLNIRPHYTQRPENGSMQALIIDIYIVLNETTDNQFIVLSQISKQYYITEVKWALKRVWLTFVLWCTLIIENDLFYFNDIDPVINFHFRVGNKE